jgi:integrase
VSAGSAGLRERHSRGCGAPGGGRCSCSPSVEAWVWSRRDGRKIRRTFAGKGAKAAAKAWRQDAAGELRRGRLRAPTSTTLTQSADAFLAGARDGSIRTRAGDAYKPSAVRGYETSLRLRVLPELGAARLSDIARSDLQDLVDRMLARGLDASTIRNTLMPVRAIFRRALVRGEIAVNPTAGLELPAVRGRRDRIASPAEAAALLEAVPERDRALWATALYAGLRRGELMALRWADVDLAAGVIRVERSWDVREGLIEPKSRAGRRTVPIAKVLREQLIAHRLRTGRSEGLAFGRTLEQPFDGTSISERAATAWRKATAAAREQDPEAVELVPITLHECRHTFASLMIAAGVNAKALSTYMGHSSVTITYDRYGHLMPGNEEQAAVLLDAFLASRTADAVAR